MSSRKAKGLIKISLYGLLIANTFGIAFAIKEFGIIKELELGNEISDSVLFWNDLLPLSLLLLQLLFFTTLLIQTFIAIRRAEKDLDNHAFSEKSCLSTMFNKIDILVKKLLLNRMGPKANVLAKLFGPAVILLLVLLILVFNPFSRLLLSWIYPAENLFHYLQQIRISLIIQILQLLWVVFISAIIYIIYQRERNSRRT